MSRIWKWLAGAAGALAAVLAAAWGIFAWRGEKQRRQHEFDESIRREEKRRDEAEGKLADTVARTDAELAEGEAKDEAVVAKRTTGSLSDYIRDRNRRVRKQQ